MFDRLPEDEYSVLRQQVLERDGWKCRHCHFRQNLHVHHIVFRSQGGPDILWNLLTLCDQCHTDLHEGCLELIIEPDRITWRHT
jgi:5-methylcytosine-specific restriction endonuclease McrA